MKHRRHFTSGFIANSLAMIVVALSGPAIQAADFHWDADADASAATGGSGVWDTASLVWRSGSPEGALASWPNGFENTDRAIFGGDAGIVVLNDNSDLINVNSITFGTEGYTVAPPAAGTATLVLSGAGPVIQSEVPAIINAVIAGDGFTKTGAGTLTLGGTNTHFGLTTIATGTLKVAKANALGSQFDAADGTLVQPGATLDLGGIALGVGTERVTVSGSGNAGVGAITSSTAIPTPFIGVRHLTLAAETTLRFTNRWDVGHNTLSDNSLFGGGHTLNVLGSGPGQASFNNLGETDLGNINVDLGNATTAIMYLQGSTTLGRPADTVKVSGGSTLYFFTNSTVPLHAKKISLESGNITVQRTGGVELAGTIALENSNTFTALSAITATGAISGGGSLTKAGAGSLTLSGANSYAGDTTVSAGLLNFKNTGAKPAGGIVIVGELGSLALGVGGTGFFSAADVDALFANTLADVFLTTGSSVATSSGIGLDTSAGDFIYAGTTTAARAFTKLGSNTLTLETPNLYDGPTTVSAGTLKLAGGTNPLSTTAAITIAAAATLDGNGGSQTTSGIFTFSSGATLQNGTIISNNAVSAGNNRFVGTRTLGDNGAFVTNQRLLIGNGNIGALVVNSAETGSLTFGGDNSNNMNYVGVGASGNGTLTLNGGTVNFNNGSGGSGYLVVGGNNNAARGALILDGGDINVGTVLKLGGVFNTAAGTNATSSLTVTSGTVTVGGGDAAGTAGTTGLNGVLYMNGHNGNNTANTGTSTLTLNESGILAVKQIQAGNGGTKTIRFNGGTVRATADAPDFLTAATGLSVVLETGGATIDTQAFNATIAAPLAAGTNPGGGLTKTGSGALTLTGANTYSGATNVAEGTLSINSAYLADGAAVTIAAGATLNLQHTDIDTVASLTLGGVTYTSGDYNSGTEGGFITGDGTIRVIAPSGGNYASWATANGIDGQPATGDFDNDGISNLVEYALGLNPVQSSVPAGTFSGGVLSFTKGSDAVANGDVTYEIETSTTLTGWTVVTPAVNDATTISYTLPAGQPKQFARLKITRVQ